MPNPCEFDPGSRSPARFDTPSSVAVRGDRAFVVDARFRPGGPHHERFVLPLSEGTTP